MISISVAPGVKEKIIAYRDIEMLRQVIEAEKQKYQKQVNTTTKYEDFRFYQGVLQAFEGVEKLLHP